MANAKGVNQGNPVVQAHTTGLTSDQAAKQNILSVCKSVLSMQSMGCHSVSEQVMAAGATDEDVKKISQITAQTVRQLEAGTTPSEPGLEAHRLPCEDVVSDDEFSTGENMPGFSNMDIEGQVAIKRSLSNAHTERKRLAKKCKQEGGDVTRSVSGSGLHSSQGHSIWRFPELVKRIRKSELELAPLFAQVGECRQKCSAYALRKNPILAPHRSVRTTTALTVTWIDSPCLFPVSLKFTSHTPSKFAIISLCSMTVSSTVEVGRVCHSCNFVT